MLLSANALDDGSTIESDLCIVGAGIAGLALALELADTNLRVCLLESGSFDLDPETQGLYEGEVADRISPALTINRLRFFGGTTNHWSGTSRPFDPIDFQERSYVPNSGWPFGYEELVAYYERAARLMQIAPPFVGDEADAEPPLKFDSKWIDPRRFYRINPLRFGEVYRDKVTGAGNITVILDANVIDIDATENASKVTRLRVATLAGRRFWARSRSYVLAAGGLENARLLLNATGVERNGLGNRHDNVGRYFQDHPNLPDSGRVVFTSFESFTPFYLHRVDEDGVGRHGIFWPTEEAQRRWEMLNCAIWLAPMRSETRARGVSSLKKIMRSIGERSVPDDFGTHLMQVITDVDEIFNAAYRKVVRRGPIVVKTWFWSECPPDPDSRVTLTDERDALGLRRIRLDWRIHQAFTSTYVRMHELLGRELGGAGIGRLQMLHAEPGEDPREHVASSAHHMGTTRMHVDPRKGVVDANCRLHGIENLYVAGSSVFPTCGQSAATFTIAALALRLADHLKQRST